MTSHEIHALSGAYAVDALDAGERELFEAHLANCATCQAEVASLTEAAALFGEVSATPPPPALRDRVLADISRTRPLPPVVDLTARAKRRRWAGFLAAAAAVATIVGGATVALTNSDNSSVISAADQVIAARDAQKVSIDLPGGASATLYRSLAENRAALVTRKMPAAPAGRVYQLWLQKDGVMVPAGLMSGSGDQAVVLDGKVAGATAAGITVEPAGGSPEPTSDPIAVFDFAQAT